MGLRWIAVLCLLATVPASAADMPGPWVEFTSDGGIDIRAITAPGMPCPKVVADRRDIAEPDARCAGRHWWCLSGAGVRCAHARAAARGHG